MSEKEVVITLPDDPHVEVKDPSGCITLEDDTIKVNCIRGQTRPEIILHVPEILDSKNPSMTIAVGASGGWNVIYVLKKVGDQWVNIFKREFWGGSKMKEYNIELDPECEYYKIVPYDGGGWAEYIVLSRTIKINYVKEEGIPIPGDLTLIAVGAATVAGVGLAYWYFNR